MSKYYKVSEEQLLNLLEASAKLAALESGGVDNWHWYGDCMREYLQEIIRTDCPSADEDFWFSDVAKLDIRHFEEIR